MNVDPPLTPWEEQREEPALSTYGAPQEFVDVANESRLIPGLRGRAKFQDPTLVLAHSATEFFKAQRARTPDERQVATDLGTAIADLAVTGRQAYGRFKNGINMLSLEGKIRQRLDAQSPPVRPSDAELRSAMDQALDRAYDVAWALRGPVAQGAELRPRLWWIAVSAEDDTPHRPVNMPAPPFEQYEVQVRTPVAGEEIALWTRFFVACVDDVPSAPAPFAARKAPDDPVPIIPGDHRVVLFLHGHSSGADEALDLIPHLLQEGVRQGKKYAVISFDLPNNGYSETFDHTRVAAPDATDFPTLSRRNAPIATPILDFIENFVVAFVDAVEDQAIANGTPRIKHRISAVIGGSLGGNLGLRLGRRNPMPVWLNRAIVSWSPASVWKAKVRDDPGREGSRFAWVAFQEPEIEESSRRDYFFRVYEESHDVGAIRIAGPQPTFWYGTSFPYADRYIQFSRVARREIYNRFFRQWHWRVACEQLIYSHVENEVYGDSSTPARYTLNTVPTLLASGEEDDHEHVRIYDGTRKLGELMTRTPGRLLLLRKTGHSIHIERPQYFASEIVKFLQGERAPELPASTVAAVSSLLLDDEDHPRPDPTAAVAAVSTLLLDAAPP
jgi:pimeloyl-ACP methyl ester carboxylesterase